MKDHHIKVNIKILKTQTASCGKREKMAHILPGCQVALTHGRYRWRHEKVLCELSEVLEVDRRRKRPKDQKQGQTQLVRQGEATAGTKAPRRKSVQDREND